MDANLHTDVVVLGGGSAGIAAAVAVARKGLQVVLIERNAYPGGKATEAEVGTVCGLYCKWICQRICRFTAKCFKQ